MDRLQKDVSNVPCKPSILQCRALCNTTRILQCHALCKTTSILNAMLSVKLLVYYNVMLSTNKLCMLYNYTEYLSYIHD